MIARNSNKQIHMSVYSGKESIMQFQIYG